MRNILSRVLYIYTSIIYRSLYKKYPSDGPFHRVHYVYLYMLTYVYIYIYMYELLLLSS